QTKSQDLALAAT
ncbi:hypothetical protein D049_4066B, partial [Vibrio parahaemolyticus VPTS-2010]